MKVLKVLTDNGWLPLYTYVLSLFMKKENNLSDLTDKNEALENLQLTGNNITSHAHDSIYLPKIQEAEDRVSTKVDDLKLATDIQIRNIQNSISASNTEIDEKLDKNLMRVQRVVPTDPVEGMVWFSTDPANPIISVYSSGAWIKYGAVWK